MKSKVWKIFVEGICPLLFNLFINDIVDLQFVNLTGSRIMVGNILVFILLNADMITQVADSM